MLNPTSRIAARWMHSEVLKATLGQYISSYYHGADTDELRRVIRWGKSHFYSP